MPTRPLLPLLFAAALALPASAIAEPQEANGGHDRGAELQQAWFAAGTPVSVTRSDIPAGEVTLTPGLAYASTGTTLRLTVTLNRAVAHASLAVILPQRFDQTPKSGIPFAGAPRLRRDAGGHGSLHRSGQTVTVALDSAAKDAQSSVAIDVRGLPAGTYALPLRWRGADGHTTQADTVSFSLLPRTREGASAGREAGADPFGALEPPRVEQDASNTSNEESETWIAVSPHDPQRLVAAGNDIGSSVGGAGGFFLSNDAGQNWIKLQMPETFRLTTTTSDGEYPSGDPIAAADDLGNIWVGGLTTCKDATSHSHIYVNRIAAGTNAPRPANAAIPYRHGGSQCSVDSSFIQDKPQLTIDNNQSSPTYGRLYATWDDLNGSAIDEVISACDTRPGGYPNAANCDTGSGWSAPVKINDTSGSYISSDVAVGPSGEVYVAWWDYSAANKISIDRCTSACTTAAGWGTDKTVALLSKYNDPVSGMRGVPFACPIVAQPGGRAAPVPSLAVNSAGRIYVGWSDIRSGSGTTRCDELPDGSGSPQSLTHETFDSFVATAATYATLVGTGTQTSGQEGTRVVTDTGTGASGTNNSDDWFPWVAVDPSTDNAFVDYYSTKMDSTRKSTHFYAATVSPTGTTQPTVVDTPAGPLNAIASDYSTKPCCTFGNDYGDYTGLAAAGGLLYPVWTQHPLGGTGEVEVDRPAAPGSRLTATAATFTEGPGANGDGKVAPGESFVLTPTLKNTSATAGATGISATAGTIGLEFASPGVSFTDATAAYPDLAAGQSAAASDSITGTLDPSVPCAAGAIEVRLLLGTDQGPRYTQFTLPICDGQPGTVTTPTTDTTTTTTDTTPTTPTQTTPTQTTPTQTTPTQTTPTQTTPTQTTPTQTTPTQTTPTTPPDTTAPDFKLSSPKTITLRLSKPFGVRFGAFAEPVRIGLVLKTVKRYNGKRVTLLKASATGPAGATLKVQKKVSRKVRRFLLAHRKLAVVESVTVSDVAGNARTHSVKFTLKTRT